MVQIRVNFLGISNVSRIADNDKTSNSLTQTADGVWGAQDSVDDSEESTEKRVSAHKTERCL